MTVTEIIKEYLVKNNYDGLYAENCGCLLDDLIPCLDWFSEDCKAGHKVEYKEDECPCGEGCPWHIKGKE